MKNIDTLREHLFDTLDALKDRDKPMDVTRARAIADVARVLVDSAKVEVEAAKVTGARRATSGFLPAPAVDLAKGAETPPARQALKSW